MAQERTYRMGLYVLDGDNNPVPWPDQQLTAWGKIMDEQRLGRSIVKQETIGDVFLSTVFLFLDHGFQRYMGGCIDPVLYETMAFRGEGEDSTAQDIWQERYRTYSDALAGHERIANEIRLLEELNMNTERHDQ